jgi:hypothetical protein
MEKGIIEQLPPTVQDNAGYMVMVPAVDSDGNDIAGIRAPMVITPLATYTGWNLRDRFFGEGAMHEFSGSTIDFPETDQNRYATGDPRPSIMERYIDEAGYLKAVERAVRILIKGRWVLEEDLFRTLELSKNWCSSRHDIRL